jgi:hypothetical protein
LPPRCPAAALELHLLAIEIEIEAGKGTHVIGFYEGPSDHSPGVHPVGDLPVTVERQGQGQIALAITSYEPVRVIVQGPGADAVGAVYLDGYHRHSVKGLPAGARVVNYSGGKDFRPSNEEADSRDHDGWGKGSVPAAYRHVASGNNGGGDRTAIEGNASLVLGLPIASVSQAYRVRAITIVESEGD